MPSTENFVLPLSHDEVVHGKGSLLGKMAGDDWQKAANLRLLFGYMYTQPGKKLLFMGGELGTWNEWYHETSLDWHLLEYDRTKGYSGGWKTSIASTAMSQRCMSMIVTGGGSSGSTVTTPKIVS